MINPGSVVLAACTMLAVGCASSPEPSAEAPAPKVYRTGSHLPAKDYGNLKTLDPEELQHAHRTAPARSLAKP